MLAIIDINVTHSFISIWAAKRVGLEVAVTECMVRRLNKLPIQVQVASWTSMNLSSWFGFIDLLVA